MIFIDTNYFLRYLVGDIEDQHDLAVKLFEEGAKGTKILFTSIIVIFELNWVLTPVLGKNREKIASVLRSIMLLSFIQFDEKNIFEQALDLFEKQNLSLADCYNLIIAKSNKAESFATFDKKLLKQFDSF